MNLTKENIFLQTISILIKIIDTKDYLDENKTLEKSENIDIFKIILSWLNNLESLTNATLNTYFTDSFRKSVIGEPQLTSMNNELTSNQTSFKYILENFKFIPIQTPNDVLKRLVQQTITSHLPQEEIIDNFILKNIYAFNFSESEMKKPLTVETDKKSIPVVLSMTAVYNNNPLLWPLILHEYGHAIFNSETIQKNVNSLDNEIKKFMMNNGISIDDKKISNYYAEIFSDLFGINYYGEAYFFAFFFHEILLNDINSVLNLEYKKNNKLIFKHTSHPPSLIRVQYMIKELQKNKMTFITSKPFISLILQEYENIYNNIANEGKIYFEIYNGLSKSCREKENIFGNNKYIVNKKVRNQLYNHLTNKMPIGTYIPDEKTFLKEFNPEDNFDLALPCDIRDIVNAGWRYFLENMVISLYKKTEEDLSGMEADERKIIITTHINNFMNEYTFLLKNLIYSIETSVITSNYSGDNNDI